jgi:U3 small nucleolar ribonucleoprotein component
LKTCWRNKHESSSICAALQGLGEIYEEEYVAAAAGGATTDDRDEKVRNEARALVKLLFAKLDALSHFHYAPKPVIEDLSVRADVPALAMEEVAPQVRAPARTCTCARCSIPRACPMKAAGCILEILKKTLWPVAVMNPFVESML